MCIRDSPYPWVQPARHHDWKPAHEFKLHWPPHEFLNDRLPRSFDLGVGSVIPDQLAVVHEMLGTDGSRENNITVKVKDVVRLVVGNNIGIHLCYLLGQITVRCFVRHDLPFHLIAKDLLYEPYGTGWLFR